MRIPGTGVLNLKAGDSEETKRSEGGFVDFDCVKSLPVRWFSLKRIIRCYIRSIP